ncbi:CPBP family intramembrane glutamic endopeptidase [Nocardiopsis alba]|uniref:CPBP family intramembrane glutamic endopeptidase n=1 Tax=Nocardiopsis alba TaxID=53437 RepID=UPI0033B12302
MPWSEILPQFSLTGTLLTVLLLFFAALGEPFLGRRAFAWLSRKEGDERALGRLYIVTITIHLLWGLLVLAVVLTSPELRPADLGLRLPEAWAPVAGGALGGLVALIAFWLLVNGRPTRDRLPLIGGRGSKRSSRAESAKASAGRQGRRGRRAPAKPMTLPDPGRRQHLLLPRTGGERALAAGMAVTGGVFGELLYRGLFIVLVTSMGVPLWIAAVLSVLLFSVAHVYQGWWGLLSAGFSGTLFTVLYLGTGSLLVPILVHVALNLRSLVFAPAVERARAEEEYDDREYDDHGGDAYDDREYDDRGDGYDDEYGYDDHDAPRTEGFDPAPTFEEPGSHETRTMPAPPPPPGPVQGPPPPFPPSGPAQAPPPPFPPTGPAQGPPPPFPPGGPAQAPPFPPSGPSQGPPPGRHTGPPSNAPGWGDPRYRDEGDTPGPGSPYRN